MVLLRQILRAIVSNAEMHARWLNTLSYLENCGARKIASCEHPTLVKEEMLKHAAEEFRHAHYLKRQIPRVTPTPFPDYSLPSLLGGMATLHYLRALDLFACRSLYGAGERLKETAYLLVTYAIELRAAEIYPIYDEILRACGSKVAVKSILLEEKEHLREMEQGLKELPQGFVYAKLICAYEGELYRNWISTLLGSCGGAQDG